MNGTIPDPRQAHARRDRRRDDQARQHARRDGLLCPLPVLKARRALKSVPPGGILEVLATDPGATKDFEHFCRTTGCEMLESGEQPGGVLRFVLKKPGEGGSEWPL